MKLRRCASFEEDIEYHSRSEEFMVSYLLLPVQHTIIIAEALNIRLDRLINGD